MMKFHGNRNGMSLIETMVALGVSTIMLFSVGTFFKLMGNSTTDIESRDRRGPLVQAIVNQIAYSDSCQYGFRLNDPDVAKRLSLPAGDLALAQQSLSVGGLEVKLRVRGLKADVDGSSDLIQVTGDNREIIPASRLRIQSFKLHDVSNPLYNLNANEEVRRGYLTISLGRISDATGGKTLRPSLVGMVTLVRNIATGEISKCYGSTQLTLEDICKEMGGVYDELGLPPCQFMAADMECEPGFMLAGIVGGQPYCVRLGGDCNNSQPGFLNFLGADSKNCDMPFDGQYKN